MILIILLFIPALCSADIFSKADNHTALDQALVKDVRNNYYRGSYDYNAYAQAGEPYDLNKESISLGSSRYSFHDSLKNFLYKQEFNSIDINAIMNQLSLPSSRLLFWQYSSPAVADLYKHMEGLGYMKLAMRYHQFEDMEEQVADPLMKLRKQSIIDCMRKRTNLLQRTDIESSFNECFDDLDTKGILPFENLKDPSDGSFNIQGKVDVTEKVLDRVNKDNFDIAVIKQIIPRVSVNQDSVFIQGAQKKDRQLISEYRAEYVDTLNGIVNEYLRSKRVEGRDLKNLSVFGVPLTEGQVKNIAILPQNDQHLVISKIASNLAYLKAIDQYGLAAELLERVMMHPAIEPGYKTFLQSSIDYVNKEIVTLKEERERLSQYADTMRSIVYEADQIRDKTIKRIETETKDQATKGLFKLGL